MVSLKAQQILFSLAREYKSSITSVSHKDMSKQIDHIKYLASQKQVPKLTLRKEIQHLEQKLQDILEIEEKVHRESKRESEKIKALKRQIKQLQQRLATSKDKDMRRKVDKMNHLLGETLAQQKTQEDVTKIGEAKFNVEVTQKEIFTPEDARRVEDMHSRAESLRHELEINKSLELKNPTEMRSIETRLETIERKLDEYYYKYPSMLIHATNPAEKTMVIESPLEAPDKGINHTLLFANIDSQTPLNAMIATDSAQEQQEEKELEMEAEAELPLPPPPKILG